MNKKFEIIPPSMPNYVRFKKDCGLRQDGFNTSEGFDIANFTEKEALDFAELMKDTFIKHYKSRKNGR